MKMSIFVETKISYTKHLEIVTGKKLQVLKLIGETKISRTVFRKHLGIIYHRC